MKKLMKTCLFLSAVFFTSVFASLGAMTVVRTTSNLSYHTIQSDAGSVENTPEAERSAGFSADLLNAPLKISSALSENEDLRKNARGETDAADASAKDAAADENSGFKKAETVKKTELLGLSEVRTAPVRTVYTATASAASAAPALTESITVAGRTLPVYENCNFVLGAGAAYVGNCRTGYGGTYSNFYYGHNSSGVFGALLSASVGQVISITRGGVTENYRIYHIESHDVSELQNYALRFNMYTAGRSGNISLQTCEGASGRRYLFASRI